jgi:hypothetical protein
MELFQRKIIISASRRQDMPACALDRLLEGVREREFVWRQPFSGKEMRLVFEPGEVFCLALWSKDFGKLLGNDEALTLVEPLNPYFLFTVNDCPELERGLRTPLDDRLDQAGAIVERYGEPRLLWRFDPIVHWRDAAGEEHDNLRSFERIAEHMAGLGVTRCVFSFAQLYGKVLKRQKRLDLEFVAPSLERKLEILAGLAGLTERLGIRMLACCQPELVGAHPNVGAASCIDGPYLAKVIDADPTGLDLSPHPSREGCGCTRSIDVGRYEACAHRCAYCYANPSLD